MAKFAIITYAKSFDKKNNIFCIGGMETYIQDLAKLVLSKGHKVEVIIPSDDNFKVTVDDIVVRGIVLRKRWYESIYQALYNYAIQEISTSQDRLIVATELLGIKAYHKQVIAIQHGIGFDYPYQYQASIEKKGRVVARFFKFLRCYIHVKRFSNYRNLVCVDYNYINWYRTLDTIWKGMKVRVIPNYTSNFIDKEKINEKLDQREKIKIIFARRFVECRGTQMFVEISKKLLLQYDNIEITFAGDGELKHLIESTFEDEPRVKLTTFNPVDSVVFHYHYDIAVVPTIYSEGTSLSLCEAMAAGCLPVVTFVGGISNIILDGYNGLMCYPSEEDFYEKMQYALAMPKENFNRMVINARESVECSFSIRNWQQKWADLLEI
ncbi:glycosyltransferase family 4 protein [Bacteroides sp.]|uniref:glycosyltransferase family 4 protein n=1 Tax=Bacteroides sp. TaxID=29523 RepID=UPI004028530B